MKKLIVVVPALLMLGACGFDKPPSETEAVRDEATTSTAAPQKVQESDAESSASSGNLAFKRVEDFANQLAKAGPGYVRFNRVRDAKGGGKERQVFVEMVGMTADQAADSAAEILQSLGYKPGRRWSDENGVRLNYKDLDGASVRVLVRSRKAHSRLKHEDATSSVYLTRPIVE